MKLCVAIIHQRDKQRVTDELVRAGFKFTVIGSTGGFLREGNSTILVGCQEEELPALNTVFETFCHAREQIVNVPAMDAGPQAGMIPSPVKVPVGGAVIFVLDVEQFHRF